jgi:hypothetical protein
MLTSLLCAWQQRACESALNLVGNICRVCSPSEFWCHLLTAAFVVQQSGVRIPQCAFVLHHVIPGCFFACRASPVQALIRRSFL